MALIRTGLIVIALTAAAASGAQAATPTLRAEAGRFVLKLPDGGHLTSTDLVGAELETTDGLTLRIDAVTPAAERPSVLLHSFSIKDPVTRTWSSACEPDAQGRRAGFPVPGRWGRDGRYIRDPGTWFLTCTSGSQGKCVLWGYAPWNKGPRGQDLAPYYQACQHMVRADYDGRGAPHTRNGTTIDVFDKLGVTASDTGADAAFAFEAGWGPNGAVCVARTRWPDLISREDLLKAAPRLGGACDETEAGRRGALIYTRVMVTPQVKAPASPAP